MQHGTTRLPEIPPARGTGGFTFLEILIALAVIAITATILLVAQGRALKAEEKTRRLERLRFVIDQVAAEVRLGNVSETFKTNYSGWRVEAGAVDSATPDVPSRWRRVDVSPIEDSLDRSTFYMLAPGPQLQAVAPRPSGPVK